MAQREDIRSIAITSHVDHGKTHLVNALLQATGAWSGHAEVVDRVMDRDDQEKERGITLSAKDTSIRYNGVKINIVDTPGHADFGGLTENAIRYLADMVCLLVDASEGPLPQTRSYLRTALAACKPIVVVINKIDRPDSRIDEVIEAVYELFLELDADESQIDFPIVYTVGRDGLASLEPTPGTDLVPLLDTILEYAPAPEYDLESPLQVLVTGLDADPYLGRVAICKVKNGTIKRGQTVAWMNESTTVSAKVKELSVTEALERVAVEEAGPGEIILVAGIEGITIGDTLSDVDNPVALPRIQVDEPNLGMTIGINTSPMVGKSGKKLTARQIKDRLDQELIGNISIEVRDTERADTWEVLGRGELQLAVLIETMRREGFELTVGKPRVVTKEINGKKSEPNEHVMIDIPEDYLGVVTQLMALRKGVMTSMGNHGTGWVRLEFAAPTRGLLGIRTEFLTETRGTGIMGSSSAGWVPWMGEIRTRQNGTLVADRAGPAAGFSIARLQERGALFVNPAEEVYEGMIIGENARAEDMSCDVTRGKKLSNVRSSGADEAINLVPPLRFSLEQSLEYIDEDECVEVTPDAIRLRKTVLDAGQRNKVKKQKG